MMAARSGYRVYGVLDASRNWSKMASDLTIARITQAGVVPIDMLAVIAELQKTWNRPDALEYANFFTDYMTPNYRLRMESYQNVFRPSPSTPLKRGLTTAFPQAFLRCWEKLLSLTPLELGIDPGPIRLAGAVAASASFPPLVGPITFHVGEAELYWHTGDSGLYENQGLESILFVFSSRQVVRHGGMR